jgi:DNA repair exonuclease SbcCD ATPase subunit
MQIEWIEIEGVKGVRDTFRPADLTLLQGPNGSGKSARMLAWLFAAYGYIPQGKTLETVAAVSPSGTGMRVRVKLDDGFGWERSIGKDPKKATLCQKLTIDGHERLGIEEAEEKIREHIGGFTANINLAEFTSLKADARRQFILHLCGEADGSDVRGLLVRLELSVLAGLLDGAQVSTYCRATFSGRDPGDLTEDQCRQACDALWSVVQNPALRDEWTKVRARLEADLVANDAAQTLLAWADATKELKSTHKAARDQANAASRKLTEDKNQLTVSAEHIQVLEGRQKVLEGQIREADEQIGACGGRARMIDTAKRAMDAAETRKIRADQALKQAKAALAGRDWAGEADGLRARAESMDVSDGQRTELQEACQAHEAARQTYREALQRAQVAVDEFRQTKQAAERELSKAAGEISAGELKLKTCRDDAWLQAVTLVDELGPHVADAGRTPYDALKALVNARCEVKDEIERLEFELEMLGSDRTNYEAAIASAAASLKQAEQALQEHQESLDSADQQYRQACELRAGLDHKLREADNLRNQATLVDREHETARRTVQQCTAALEDTTRDHAAAVAQHEQAIKDAGDGQNVAELQTARANLAGQLATVKQQIADKQKLASLERELNNCIASAAQEGIAFEVAEATQDAVKATRETILAGLVRPLLSRIDEFLAAAGLPYRSYCDLETARGKAIFDLGWVVDVNGLDRKVSLDTLSDGQAALFGSALAYALTVLGGNPLRVIQLEADNLDREMFGCLQRALASLADNFDHAIVARWDTAPVGDEWHVQEFSLGVVAAAA